MSPAPKHEDIIPPPPADGALAAWIRNRLANANVYSVEVLLGDAEGRLVLRIWYDDHTVYHPKS
jgi:hypothetical protein